MQRTGPSNDLDIAETSTVKRTFGGQKHLVGDPQCGDSLGATAVDRPSRGVGAFAQIDDQPLALDMNLDCDWNRLTEHDAIIVQISLTFIHAIGNCRDRLAICHFALTEDFIAASLDGGEAEAIDNLQHAPLTRPASRDHCVDVANDQVLATAVPANDVDDVLDWAVFVPDLDRAETYPFLIDLSGLGSATRIAPADIGDVSACSNITNQLPF